MMNINLFTSNR